MARIENLTILFLDMVDFAERTARLSRSENQHLLRTYLRLLRPVIARFGGWQVKSVGDELLVTFQSPTDGVHCGMALQDAVAEYNLGAARTGKIQIRVALNAGEVGVTRDDVVGDAVNIAARVLGVTPPGEVRFTEAVHLVVNRSEVPAKALGAQALRGLAEPVCLYRVPPRLVQRLVAVGEDYVPGQEELLPFGGMHRAAPVDEPPEWLPEFLYVRRAPAGPRAPGARLTALLAGLVAVSALALWYTLPGLAPGPLRVQPPPATVSAAIDPAEAHRQQVAQMFVEHAHTAWTESRHRDAALSYAKAISLDSRLAADPVTAANLVDCLSWCAETAMPLIRQHFNPVLREHLSRRTRQAGAVGRSRAITLLRQMGAGSQVDELGALMQDLREAETCTDRLGAVRGLRILRDPRALPVLRSTLDSGVVGWVSNLCLRSEAKAAVSELEHLPHPAETARSG